MILIRSLILLVFILVSCGGQDATTIVVGMELEFPPFETTDEEGNPIGISVDFAEALGKKLDRKIKIVNIRFSGLIPALQSNQIDMIISSMSSTEERAKQIDFSKPYGEFNLTYLAGIDTDINDVSDLNSPDVTLAVKSGTIAHTLASTLYPLAQLKVVDQTSVAILEVVQGRSDAFVYDLLAILKAWQQYPNETKTTLKSIPNSEAPIAIGFNKNNTELQQQVAVALDEFIAEHGFDPIVEKYLSKEKEEFTELDLPFIFK